MSENLPDNKLTAKQTKALEALLTGVSKGEAAAAAGVNPRTLHRWINENLLFWNALQNGKHHSIFDSARRVVVGMETAVQVILEVLEDKKAPAAVRLRAAQLTAELSLRLTEQTDILERLDELEAKVIGNEGRH